jgi:two-component system, chemotaxis family, chemotaxis protein CheY
MKTILVVEDFIAVQHFLRGMLESKGYRTLGAPDGNKAYEILANLSNVDLVLSDYHMPNSNGYDLLKKIRENSDINHLPVVFLTTEGNPQVVDMSRQLGYTAWIKKPYRAEALFEELEKIFPASAVQWSLFE